MPAPTPMNSATNATRRDFLRTASYGALAAAGAAGLPRTSLGVQQDDAAQQAAQNAGGKKIGFAVMGLGQLGLGQIVPAFKHCKLAKLTALVSGKPEKARATAAKFGVDAKNIYNYDDFDKIKDNDQVDVVYVVLPNNMHADFVVRAAAAGKHVLCEKPFDITVEKCQQAIDACRKAGRKLQVGYRLMYEPNNLAMVEAVRKKECGQLEMVECGAGFRIGDPNQWRLKLNMSGGGCLMDIGIYSLNAARYITGEEPTEVTAFTYADRTDPRFREVEEHCNFQLRFPSGVLASCTSSYDCGLNRFRAVCSRGWAGVEPALSYNGVKFHIQRPGRQVESPDLGDPNQFAAEMDALADCIINNKEPKASGDQGLRDVRIMLAIYEAAKTGKTIRLQDDRA